MAAVGGKAALLKLALDWALVGDDEPVAMSQRPVVAEMQQLTSAHDLLARWARFVAELEDRAAPLAAVLAGAADADPEAAVVHARSERNRREGAVFTVDRLAALDALRPGLSAARAAASGPRPRARLVARGLRSLDPAATAGLRGGLPVT